MKWNCYIIDHITVVVLLNTASTRVCSNFDILCYFKFHLSLKQCRFLGKLRGCVFLNTLYCIMQLSPLSYHKFCVKNVDLRDRNRPGGIVSLLSILCLYCFLACSSLDLAAPHNFLLRNIYDMQGV